MATSAARTGVTVDAARARTRRDLYEGMIDYQRNQRPERGVDVEKCKDKCGLQAVRRVRIGVVQHNQLRIDTHQPVPKKECKTWGDS